jgi:hypothetical protein
MNSADETSEEPTDRVSGENDHALRSMLRGALRDATPPPNVLSGFQAKVRARSRGKFYADGWSTSRHPPITTYLITSLLMIAVLGTAYALLSPLAGSAEPVHNEPVPVQVVPAPR